MASPTRTLHANPTITPHPSKWRWEREYEWVRPSTEEVWELPVSSLVSLLSPQSEKPGVSTYVDMSCEPAEGAAGGTAEVHRSLLVVLRYLLLLVSEGPCICFGTVPSEENTAH